MTANPKYPKSIYWSKEDGGVIALAKDLPGCSAFGETEQEALKELDDAIDAWLDAARLAGNPIPEPSQIVAPQEHSGRILLRMPKQLHAALSYRATEEEVSLNQYIVYLLATGLAANPIPQKPSHVAVLEAAPLTWTPLQATGEWAGVRYQSSEWANMMTSGLRKAAMGALTKKLAITLEKGLKSSPAQVSKRPKRALEI
jgi:antitoxin HicB